MQGLDVRILPFVCTSRGLNDNAPAWGDWGVALRGHHMS